MKKILPHILFLSAINIFANNYFTAEQYDILNKTSPSLQNIINEYHNDIIKKRELVIFDFESKSDGSEDGPKTEYKNFFRTKNGYEGAELQLLKLKAGNEKFAIIGRQFGNSTYDVNARIHDYAFMKRSIFNDGSIDILWGINLHDEPEFETIDNVKYFTSKDSISVLKLVGNFKIYDIDVNLEVNEDSEIEKTLLAYNFHTKIGKFIPKVLRGTEPFKYYDTYFIYESNELFYNNDFHVKAMIKNRTIDNNKEENYQSGMIASLIEIEKNFSILKIYAGYSKSNEFTKDELTGSMIKIGIAAPKKIIGNKKAEFYFGNSKNYYDDLIDIRMIDQDISLFGVKFYW